MIATKPSVRITKHIAIADAADTDKFHLFGHDFGAINAWLTALLYPERIISLTALSTPHPRALLDAFEKNS